MVRGIAHEPPLEPPAPYHEPRILPYKQPPPKASAGESVRKDQHIRIESEVDRHLYTNLPTENGDTLKYQAAVKLTPKEYEGVERLVKAGYFLNVSDFVRFAVRDKLEALKPTIVRRISTQKAMREVYQYIKSHPEVYPDEIADALSMDLEAVMGAVSALISKKKVKESA
ncbi:MAG: hypothetical protein AVW05_03585 [Hadesarchaea archaeon DG-33]|nr:MAG: hypothetical protein AVW05_03585 [Hadesarchaea archaeon DG-33]